MMMTREEYYAQIKDMYAQKYESTEPSLSLDSMAETRSQRPLKIVLTDETREMLLSVRSHLIKVKETFDRGFAQIEEQRHASRLSLRSRDKKEENPEDQVLNDEESVDTDVATELIGIEDGTVKREANAEVISAIVEKEQIPQIQLCEHQRSILQVSHVKETEEFPHRSTSGNGENVAHQLFDQMPLRIASKEKRRKSLKAWKFKFKPTSKRSRLRDDKFSFVDATVWLNKDPKEVNWGCVNKEFKEVVAGCRKTRVDQFKLVDKNELRSEVLDQIVTFMYHQALDSDSTQKPVHVKEMEAPLYPHKSTGNNLHHIAHQLLDKRCLRIHSKKLKTKCLKSWRFKFKISSTKARPKLFCFVVDYYGIIGFARFLELCYTLNLFVTQDEGFMESFNNLVCSSWIDEQFERRWSTMICRFEHNEND